ncbi:MAG: transglutaminase family protein [Burkholderiales bacterium]|nr:transglutaminase family protein [Burkholderiales bacterium]
MILEITHSLTYRYSQPVYLEPYILRLTPRSDGAQALQTFELRIDPKPQHSSAAADLDGATSHCLHFSGSHDRLCISTRSVVETLRTNPYDFLLRDAAYSRIPLAYPGELRAALQIYLQRGEADPQVDALARTLALDNRDGTLDFLADLTRRIHQVWRNEHRESGAPRRPGETLTLARGTCRDLAVLWMDACRAAGVAARFVSGYKLGEGDDSEHHLHAWAEAYLPGGGWRGFDPSTGLAVVDRHVALAASAFPALASPGQGSFRGEALSELATEVAVRQRVAKLPLTMP